MTAPLRAGSLCSGYGGLEMGAALALGPIECVWHGEYDSHASAVLAANWPGVPNLGDIAAVTAGTSAFGAWDDQKPIDILLAGYPCQPFSDAGLRRGLDDPRNRWPDVAAAIRALRPRIVVLENVRGHLNRGFDTVAASLASMRYVGRWRCVRAADTGAAHRRERLFIIAWPEEEATPRLRGADAPVAGDNLSLLPTPMASDGRRCGNAESLIDGRTARGCGPNLAGTVVNLLPTPRARDGKGRDPNPRGVDLNEAVALLPTPRTSDANGAGNDCDGGMDLRTAVTLLPMPRASDGEKSGPNQRGSSGDLALPATVQPSRWGAFAPAVARWQQVIGRPAPPPTATGKKGQQQLSPAFVEWLMGLPPGHVTDVVAGRGDALRVLGNGVVPQAAALALRLLLTEPEQPTHAQLDLLEAVPT